MKRLLSMQHVGCPMIVPCSRRRRYDNYWNVVPTEQERMTRCSPLTISNFSKQIQRRRPHKRCVFVNNFSNSLDYIPTSSNSSAPSRYSPVSKFCANSIPSLRSGRTACLRWSPLSLLSILLLLSRRYDVAKH